MSILQIQKLMVPSGADYPTLTDLTVWTSGDYCTGTPHAYIRVNGEVADWDGGTYKLSVYVRDGNLCANSYALWYDDISVSAGLWPSGSPGYLQRDLCDLVYADPDNCELVVSGDDRTNQQFEARVIRRSDSAVMDTMASTCAAYYTNSCGGS